MAPVGTTKTFNLTIDVLAIPGGGVNGGDGYVAIANPGGVRVRGSMMQDQLNAVRNLLIVMGNAQGDSDIGLMLAVNDSDITEAMGSGPALGKGTATEPESGGGGSGGD